MSIFSRSSNTTKEPPVIPADAAAAVGQPQGQADVRFAPPPIPSAPTSPPTVAPRPAAPGVVPPPAAPLYSMRPADDAAESAVAEKVRLAREAQLRNKARVTSPRTTPTGSAASAVRRQQLAPAPTAKRAPTPQTFDPLRAAQTGLLKLAWSWQQAGSPIRAIHAYMELLFRYPDSAAADAAIADLVALSDTLASEGQFHTALAIYDHIERWAMMEELA